VCPDASLKLRQLAGRNLKPQSHFPAIDDITIVQLKVIRRQSVEVSIDPKTGATGHSSLVWELLLVIGCTDFAHHIPPNAVVAEGVLEDKMPNHPIPVGHAVAAVD